MLLIKNERFEGANIKQILQILFYDIVNHEKWKIDRIV